MKHLLKFNESTAAELPKVICVVTFMRHVMSNAYLLEALSKELDSNGFSIARRDEGWNNIVIFEVNGYRLYSAIKDLPHEKNLTYYKLPEELTDVVLLIRSYKSVPSRSIDPNGIRQYQKLVF